MAETLETERGYCVKRSYLELYRELVDNGARVVCFVDYQSVRPSGDVHRDVAEARFHTVGGGVIQVGVRGTCYIWARQRQEFVAQCENANLTYIPNWE